MPVHRTKWSRLFDSLNLFGWKTVELLLVPRGLNGSQMYRPNGTKVGLSLSWQLYM
jgi:hypothetical protein